MTHLPPPAAQSQPPSEPAVGIVALRAIGPVLIELPFPIVGEERPWAASIWLPAGGGCGRQLWTYDPTLRGWLIPPSCHHGTVVELATATRRRRRPVTVRAWYGVAVTHDQHWLVCASPTCDPNVAARYSRALTDRHRLAVIERHR